MVHLTESEIESGELVREKIVSSLVGVLKSTRAAEVHVNIMPAF